jgi:hypothetical protein
VTGEATYEDLVTAATVGLDRRAVPLAGLAGPAGEHAGLVDEADPAAGLLDAAALLYSARRAGVVPGRADLAQAAAPETAPELSAAAAGVLGFALRRNDAELAADLLTATAAAGFRVRAPLLPAVLDAAVRHRALRGPAGAVLGERGRWLAEHREDWRRVVQATAPVVPNEDPLTWETGSRGERLAWLAALRQRDPAAAREVLVAAWARETGEDREELIAVLATRLSPADEPFLEAALDDRRQTVRRVAARLLTTLSESAFVRRAVARAADVLRLEGARAGLDGAASARRSRPGASSPGSADAGGAAGARSAAVWPPVHLVASLPGSADAGGAAGARSAAVWPPVHLVASLPESSDAEAVRDGISPGRPSPAIGTRAWLLTQVIAAVPLGQWTARFGLSPAELAGLPVAGGLRVDVHAGWRLAAVAQGDAGWAVALLAAGDRPDGSRPPEAWPPAVELEALLPAADRLARARAFLVAHGPTPEAVALLATCPTPWDEALADAVLELVTRAARTGQPRRTAWLLKPAARQLPVSGGRDYVAALRALAQESSPDTQLSAQLTLTADTVDRRRLFEQELSVRSFSDHQP